jgi:serine-type D-Ala-D-Ala carboxypeptidase/endopeptidase (penicillin-binding protein 4)
MKKLFLLLPYFICGSSFAQSTSEQLAAAFKKLESDEQFKHAIISMYAVHSKTGEVIIDKNAQTGLAPASCQKVITSVSAFELLGTAYRYKTEIGYDGNLKEMNLKGNLYVVGYGDPTLGSWRWGQTSAAKVLANFKEAVSKKINKIEGNIFGYDRKWESNITPNGWVWEDIGNYYGAGASALNWRENQYDIYLKAGEKPGDKTSIKKIIPAVESAVLFNEVITAAKGTGDNAYIFLPPYSNTGFVRGTIPIGENDFKISGSIPDPAGQMVTELAATIKKPEDKILLIASYNGSKVENKDLPVKPIVFYTYYSPSFDSINYWFLKKSINLYGEAFVKTIAYEKLKFGSTDSGIAIIKDFWSKRGIEKSGLNIIDGSGLSPANRVTTNALVTVMQYARQQKWFTSFYNALPEMNGIKMKDGYINGVRSYTGYIKSTSGNEYTFSLIVNNFDGNPATVREKMWKVLDILK